MLTPSYSDLMKRINQDSAVDERITSRYVIVLAVAKRARQIIDEAIKREEIAPTEKAVSMAVDEMNRGEIKVLIKKEKKQKRKISSVVNVVNLEDDVSNLEDYEDFKTTKRDAEFETEEKEENFE